jgi:hypothetical protein
MYLDPGAFFSILLFFIFYFGGGSGGLYPRDWHTDVNRRLDCGREAFSHTFVPNLYGLIMGNILHLQRLVRVIYSQYSLRRSMYC